MKIGIDIDGVILDSEAEFRVQSELYDVIKLNKNSIIDNKEIKVQSRYSWSEEELNTYINQEFIKVSKQCNFMPGAVEVINLLKNEGHELIIITARGGIIKEMRNVAEKRLEEKGLKSIVCELREYSKTGKLTFIEWAEFGLDEIPSNALNINVEYDENNLDIRYFSFISNSKTSSRKTFFIFFLKNKNLGTFNYP